MPILLNSQTQTNTNKTMVLGGLPVRTNLRAGLAWDDLDDQAKALFDKLKNAVSQVTDSTPSTTTPA